MDNVQNRIGSLALVSGEKNFHISGLHSRENKHYCRQSVQNEGYDNRAPFKPHYLSPNSCSLWPAGDRPLCFRKEPPSKCLRFMDLGSKSSRHRCLFNRLGNILSQLHVSPLQSSLKMSTQNPAREGISYSNSPFLEVTTMVPNNAGDALRPSSSSTNGEKCFSGSTISSEQKEGGPIKISRLACLTTNTEMRSVPERVSNILQA